MRILFVCTGNSCRSVMAHQLLKRVIRTRPLVDWHADSCGLAANPAFPAPLHVKTVLSREGIVDFEHTPRQITGRLVEWADLVLVMEEDQKKVVERRFASSRTPVALLRGHVDLPEPEIEDPVHLPLEVYERCFARIKEAVEALVEKYEANSKKAGS
ncbi:MAG: hypothetical protein HY611_03885 [Elusimicrobia bacterium]|nr:hypothetical protein [Elusimicrobiota bacterium]